MPFRHFKLQWIHAYNFLGSIVPNFLVRDTSDVVGPFIQWTLFVEMSGSSSHKTNEYMAARLTVIMNLQCEISNIISIFPRTDQTSADWSTTKTANGVERPFFGHSDFRMQRFREEGVQKQLRGAQLFQNKNSKPFHHSRAEKRISESPLPIWNLQSHIEGQSPFRPILFFLQALVSSHAWWKLQHC